MKRSTRCCFLHVDTEKDFNESTESAWCIDILSNIVLASIVTSSAILYSHQAHIVKKKANGVSAALSQENASPWFEKVQPSLLIYRFYRAQRLGTDRRFQGRLTLRWLSRHLLSFRNSRNRNLWTLRFHASPERQTRLVQLVQKHL